MADIEEALYSRLTSTTAVSTIVATRVYPDLIADSTTVTPYIVFEKTSGDHVKSMSGIKGVAEAEHEINCVTSGTSAYKSAKALRNAVRLSIDGQAGTWGGVKVRYCSIEDEFDGPELAVGKDQQRRSVVGLRTRSWFFESTT